MALNFNNGSYRCDYTDFGVNEDGDVVITFYSSTSTPEQMTQEGVKGIASDPLFASMMRLAYDNAVPETKLWYAFERLAARGGNAIFRFGKSDTELEAAA